LTLLKYLDAELDYRLKKEDKRNCNESIIKFKELIAENPNNPYNDRAVVFMYLCSKENDALSDSKDMIKKVVNEYTNSPYYNRFLYEDALNDYDNGRNKKFIYKLKTIIKTSKNYELKLYAIYKMYGFYLKQYNVAEAYELIIENAQEYSKYSSYPISPYFFISFGDALFFNREFAKAREIYENVIKLTPNISLVKYAKVRISDTYLYQYDYQKVEEYFKKNKDFFNEKDIGSQLAQIRVAEYEGSFYEDDKLTQKFNIMQQYLKDSTLREELIFREAQIYFYKEDYLYAYLKIKKLLNDYPKTTLMMTAKEMIDRIIYAVYLNEYLGKKYTRIYQLYADNSEIIKLHPEYFNLAYIIMNSLNELEQYDKLIQLINYILTKKLPQNLENVFLYKVAYAYLNKGNYYKAIHAINYIKIKDKRFKNNFKNYKFLGDYYWKMKKYKLSIRNYNKALSKKEMDKESKIKINNKLSNFFFKKRAYSPALRYYIESNKIKENNEILLKIGEIYYYMGEYDKVIVVLNKFLIKNKNNDELSHVYYKIGNSWIKKGKYDKGIFILEDFVKKQEANKTEDFWLSQIKDLIKYEKYKNKLNKLKEININRSGL
jgi:tetratricopeptide (TPR) repeat protein